MLLCSWAHRGSTWGFLSSDYLWVVSPFDCIIIMCDCKMHFWGGGSVVVDLLFIVTPIIGVCNCSMFNVCYFMFILVSQSSWLGRESWLLCLVCLLSVSWLLYDISLQCHGFVCSLWLWYFRIIITYFFWVAAKITLTFFNLGKDTFLSLTFNLGGHVGLMSPISLRTWE